jgi:membrane protease YdiL (CAAX protease family)
MHSAHSSGAAIRNLAVFAAVAVSAGWIGRGLDVAVGSPASEGPGQLVWIAAPALTGLLLRAFAGDGWTDAGLRPSFGANRGWYLFALFFSPVSTLLMVLVGLAFGIMRFAAPDAGHLLRLIALALLPSFFKNIFEEFAWRGYLTPRLSAAGAQDALNHALTGIVWAAWHVPYYLFFLDRATFAAISPHGEALFYTMMFAGVISLALVYGELRLLSGSVWPVVMLHTVSNAVTGTMLLSGCFRMTPMADLVVSPLPGSLLSIALNVALWLWLSRYRRSGG